MTEDPIQQAAADKFQEYAQENPVFIKMLTDRVNELHRAYSSAAQMRGPYANLASSTVLNIYVNGMPELPREQYEQQLRTLLMVAAPNQESLGQFAQSLGITLPEEP